MAEYDKELTDHEAAQADLFPESALADSETEEVAADVPETDDTRERLEVLEGFVKHHLSTHGEFDTYVASLDK
ncbi:hypothetical protein Toil_gp21 [Rhodococcus phage Toil]|uniref:Uncharacterized protein n=1 Tax=Rhodococcus phage Toil TaxID=1975614 RepID=A0A1W6DXR6_9VIRU|nr:hypothetical protein KMD62_gp21 [Rhodococcus phage Toil]ARK07704.1 hypothetical protein Toil_gp21 [Rhodococcus phage Toil]